MQQKARALRNFKSDAKGIVKSKTKYDHWIEEGLMTEEHAADEMKADMTEVETNIKAVHLFLIWVKPPGINHLIVRPQAMSKITSQAIWDLLDKQDDDSKIAWKDEDASLARILQWITDHPKAKEVNEEDQKRKKKEAKDAKEKKEKEAKADAKEKEK
jgi:hypothetical protein